MMYQFAENNAAFALILKTETIHLMNYCSVLSTESFSSKLNYKI